MHHHRKKPATQYLLCLLCHCPLCRAEGRTLQAVSDPSAPPRVNNHNFGSWESWYLVNGHLVNCRWTHKALPLAVLPLEACCLDDLRREERIRLQYERQLHTRVMMRFAWVCKELLGCVCIWDLGHTHSNT